MLSVNTAGYNFITCWSETPFTFQLLIPPFQTECWIAVCLTATILTLLIVEYVKFLYPNLQGPFSAQLLIIAAFFEKSLPWPKTLLCSTSFRISMGIFSVVSIVLTQGYVGVLITALSSAFPPTRVTTFDKLTTPVCNYDTRNLTGSNRCPSHIWVDTEFEQLFGSRPFSDVTDFKIFSTRNPVGLNVTTEYEYRWSGHNFFSGVVAYMKGSIDGFELSPTSAKQLKMYSVVL